MSNLLLIVMNTLHGLRIHGWLASQPSFSAYKGIYLLLTATYSTTMTPEKI
jgi:hypothetical protein